MIIEKLERQNNFTSQEKSIAQFILQSPEAFQQMSCEELGKATFTSKSTVVRLCKKLDVSGYQELKKILYFERNKQKQKTDVKIDGKSTFKDILATLPEIYKSSIEEVNLCNNKTLFQRILNRMRRMDQIDFYGTGFGYALLESVAQKLNSFGIESKAYNTLNERYLAANLRKTKLMAFVMTFSGNNPLAIREAEVLKRMGIYVVGVVGPYADEIGKSCDEVLRLPEKAMQSETGFIRISQCVNYMMDIFVTGMLINDYDEIVARGHIMNYVYDKEMYYDTKVSKIKGFNKKL